MALMTCRFFSEALELSTSMTVILPQATSNQIGMQGVAAAGGRHATLYLLHGLSDDDSIWLRRTSIERYVAPLGLAVVMPQVHRSFYADEAHGMPFWTFLTEELPALAGSFFPISDAREDTFVAGLSMGGYGAFKWALHRPDRFAAAASLSGALDLAGAHDRGADPVLGRALDNAFGPEPRSGTGDDVFWLLEQRAAEGADLPALYVACGTEDVLAAGNRRFVASAERHGVPLTASIGPGDHDWDYWDARIQDVLAWLPLGER